MASIVEGEQLDDDKKPKTPERIAKEKAIRARRRERGLNNVGMVDVFATWYAYSGPQASLNPIWVAEWPAWFRDDIRFMMSELAYAKEVEDQKKKQKAPKPDKPKKGVRRR